MNFSKIREHSALPWFILVLLAFIWGSSFILIKKGLDAFSPVQVGSIRIVFAGLCLLPFALRYLKSYKNYWKKFFLYGMTANLLPAILFALAETGISSSLAGILNSLTPIMTFIIGIIVFHTVIKKGQVIGLMIGFAGSFALSFINNAGGLGSFNYFALFVIVATICYGISANMVKVSFHKINSVVLTSLALFFVGPLGFIYLFSSDFLTRVSSHPDALASLGYLFLLGAFGTAFALVLFNKLIQITTAVFATSVTYLIPVIAVLWGILDGEDFFTLHFLGMLLIVAGVYIINKFK